MLLWKSGRVADCVCLENRSPARDRGFESYLFRKQTASRRFFFRKRASQQFGLRVGFEAGGPIRKDAPEAGPGVTRHGSARRGANRLPKCSLEQIPGFFLRLSAVFFSEESKPTVSLAGRMDFELKLFAPSGCSLTRASCPLRFQSKG